jgi:type II secretory pathway pseudopilin PulG
MAATTALVVGAAAAVAGTWNAVNTSKEARRQAKYQQAAVEGQAANAARDLKDRQDQEERIATRDRQRMDQRRRLTGQRLQSRSTKILSSTTGGTGGSPSDEDILGA